MSETQVPSPPPKRLLILDDEPMMVRAIKRLMAGEYAMTSPGTPADAVAEVRGGARFDVILCDLMMPFMSGIQFYDAIRAIDPEQARRIVFMTGGAYAPLVLEFLSSVANPRIDKPVGRLALRAAIQAIGP